MWLDPDYSRILELFTKCSPFEALEVTIKTRSFLDMRGVNLSGDQQTKRRPTNQNLRRPSSSSPPASRPVKRDRRQPPLTPARQRPRVLLELGCRAAPIGDDRPSC